MLVVLSIIGIITSVAVTGQAAFNRSFILSNTAYDIALTLRSAEAYGLGNRAIGDRSTGYGLNFNRLTPSVFTLFVDSYRPVGSESSQLCHPLPANDPRGPDARPGNCAYDASQGERKTAYTLGNGITINKFCANDGSWRCSTELPCTEIWLGGRKTCVTVRNSRLSSLDIIFARPDTQPFMSVNGSYSKSSPVSQACLEIASPQGSSRYIYVFSSGAITTNALSCPP